MATLSNELYGRQVGALAQDTVWDDVIPIPLNEPEDALAQIAYPDNYAEGKHTFLRSYESLRCSSES